MRAGPCKRPQGSNRRYRRRSPSTPSAAPAHPFRCTGTDCLAEEDGSVIVRDDLDALLQVGELGGWRGPLALPPASLACRRSCLHCALDTHAHKNYSACCSACARCCPRTSGAPW